ncbi:MAG: NAD(P)-dependent oxidoreductase [Rhizobiaceae bacterium]|nr:NAD(P)-dependent oxidoreductase [Rhizobiaceae bacterium]
MSQTIGMVGVGVMGFAMSHNLLKHGFAVAGYDPSSEAMARLQREGGTPCPSPRAVAEAAQIIFLSLPSPAALHAAIDGPDGLAAASGPAILIECSTLPLADKRAAEARLAASGKTLLDCPLSGTGAQAMNRDLVVFASGDEAAYRTALPAMHGMSRAQRYLGAFGNGSIMKYVANLLVTIHNVAAGEAMVLGMKAGLDPALIYDTLADSAGSSRMFQVRGPLMRDNSYDKATATVRTHLKDLAIIGDFAAGLNVSTPVFAAAGQLYHVGAATGRELQDTASVCAVLEQMAGIDRRPKD